MKRLLIALAGLAALALPATASASGYWTSNHFYSPSRMTECRFMPAKQGEQAWIACENFRTRQVAIVFQTGKAINVTTGIKTMRLFFNRYGTGHTLDYGQTYTTAGAKLRCYAQTDADAGTFGPAMQCWSRISGHGFLINANGIKRF